MVDFKANEEEVWILTAEGQSILKDGSHEVKVFNFIPAGETGINVNSIKVIQILYQFLNSCFRNHWENQVKLVKVKLSRINGSV